MGFGLIFWILMLLWLVFRLTSHFGVLDARWSSASDLFLFILFLLLGWHDFGAPVHSQ